MPEATAVRTEPPTMIALLDAEALVLAEIAGAFGRMFAGNGERDGQVSAILAHAAASRAIVGEVVHEHKTARGVTADRAAITALFKVVDSVVAEIEQTAQTVRRYNLALFDPNAQQLAHGAVDAVDAIATALPFLRSASRYRAKMRCIAMELIEFRVCADDLDATGLHALFEASADTTAYIAQREIHRHLRYLADRLDAVATILEALAD
ncbi:DUF47 family protein [Sphingomonas sp. JC676]|uniref:DUF47 domain-containing protein n=1 Tax=Sphingomonas sp. JC676 TaxID=2768065 RepID=UPI001657A311|nr:DUF47 family protein [Sphingomonas sp. JC676]MBC9032673.1 DUF47 family protein [Sphingomonas sp. JC676]